MKMVFTKASMLERHYNISLVNMMDLVFVVYAVLRAKLSELGLILPSGVSYFSIDILIKLRDMAAPITLLMDDLPLVKRGYMIHDTIEYLTNIYCKLYSEQYHGYGGLYTYSTDHIKASFNDEIPALKIVHNDEFILQKTALESKLIDEAVNTLTSVDNLVDMRLFEEFGPSGINLRF